MIRLMVVCMLAMSVALPLQAKDKNDSIEDAIGDAIRDEIYDDDKHKGKGRPDNPGEHGRDNARRKQCENPGKGSKCDYDWEDIISDDDDDPSTSDPSPPNPLVSYSVRFCSLSDAGTSPGTNTGLGNKGRENELPSIVDFRLGGTIIGD